MAVKLIANYAKRLGLPGYSSHQFSVSVETELTSVEDVAGESARLYGMLQQAVDEQIQQTGFVPPDGYGLGNIPTTNNANVGYGRAGQPYGANGIHRNGNGDLDVWRCTDGQKGLIKRLVNENDLDKDKVEALAQQLFGAGVKQLDRLQASQLIEELLEQNGKKRNGSRGGPYRRQEARP
jgi:hypothetical protein